MKLQFKHQKFQADAAKTVVDVFAGQPYLTSTYLIDRGSDAHQFTLEAMSFTGWRNEPIVPVSYTHLNDRGMPLSDSDIFKAQFYKYYSDIGKKDLFIKQWKDLEELTESIFHPLNGTPMDELFTRYMYYILSLIHI